MKINRYVCDESARENIHFFHGSIYASSREAVLAMRSDTVPWDEFAIRCDTWAVAIAIAKEMFRKVKKGSPIMLGLAD